MRLIPVSFTVSDQLYNQLTNDFNKSGKNSHIGGRAVAIVREYFTLTNPEAQISIGTNGGDLDLKHDGIVTHYEIKGTEENSIAFNKLRVSSQACYNGLKAGMTLIRVCNVGQKEVKLFFLKYGEDFDLKPECRWVITPVRKSTIQNKK